MEAALPKRSWWNRNWKWVVPVGCVLPVLVCGGFITMLIFGVMGALKSAEPYVESIALVQNDSAVQAALGTPIDPGFGLTGSIETANGTGECDVNYTISGPNGSASVSVVATRSGGEWTYEQVLVTVDDTGEEIDLTPTQ